jgi:hypothetical protein
MKMLRALEQEKQSTELPFGLPGELIAHTVTLAAGVFDGYHSLKSTQVMASLSRTCRALYYTYFPRRLRESYIKQTSLALSKIARANPRSKLVCANL